jgi:hypothetical protein
MSYRSGRRTLGALFCVALLAGAVTPDDPALLDAVKKGDVAAVGWLRAGGAGGN